MAIDSFYDPTPRHPLLASIVRLPLVAARLLRRRGVGWLRDYSRQTRFDYRSMPKDRPIDVMVLVTDHFETAEPSGNANPDAVRAWCDDYERLANRHRDADGRPPQHTWFPCGDDADDDCLRLLSQSAFDGFGEVELCWNDKYQSRDEAADALNQHLERFHRHGAMVAAEARPRSCFGCITGDSSPAAPISALREAGCYGDFTVAATKFPYQTRKTNSPYYASDDGRPHDSVEVGGWPADGLLRFPSPLVVDWSKGRVDDGLLSNAFPAHPARLPAWLSANIHVPGRPEWIFVKLHARGMDGRSSFCAAGTDAMLSSMQECWNEPPFRLHYVTCREAYNIVCAAEAGLQGDPNEFRDFAIPPPANRIARCTTPWRLRGYAPDKIQIELLEDVPAKLEIRGPASLTLTGRFREVEVRYRRGQVADVRFEGPGPVRLDPPIHVGHLPDAVSLAA